MIDFDKSLFWNDALDREYKYTADEKANAWLRRTIKELYVTKDILQYDMIYIGGSVNYGSYHIISERLKIELEKQKFKGLRNRRRSNLAKSNRLKALPLFMRE